MCFSCISLRVLILIQCMLRANITSLCRQCLSLSIRTERSAPLLFYSSIPKRKDTGNSSEPFKIGGIYGDTTASANNQSNFKRVLKGVQSVRSGGNRDNKSRGQSKDKTKDSTTDDSTNKDSKYKKDFKSRDRRDKYRDKSKKDKKPDPRRYKKTMKKAEPFVLHKPKPQIEDEEDALFENTMFKRVRVTTKPEDKPADKPTKTTEKTTTKPKETKVKANADTNQQPETRQKRPTFKIIPEKDVDEEMEEDEGEEPEDEVIAEESESRPEAPSQFTPHKVLVAEDNMRMDRWMSIHYPTIPHAQVCKMLRSRLVRFCGSKSNYFNIFPLDYIQLT